jgi:tetratricopeptide (TPR) repeat protein
MRLTRRFLLAIALVTLGPLVCLNAPCESAFALGQAGSGAADSVETAIPAGAGQSPQQDSGDERLGEARTLIYEGKYSEGTAILNEILSENPDSREALYLLATAYEWQNKLEDAERVYRTIVSVNEDDLEAWEQVAKLEAWRSNFDESILLYGKLISKFGDKPSLLIGLARTLSWANRLDEALLYYDRVILQEPDNAEALAGRAQVLRWTGDLRGARKSIRKAQAAGPGQPEVEREAKQIELQLSPKLTLSYSESLEKNYLRSGGSYDYNLGNRTWKAEADFFPEQLESVGLDFWSARDWEADRSLGLDNYRVSSMGFSAAAGVPVGEIGSVGGSFTVRSFERYRENVQYPLLGEESRVQDYEVWTAARRGVWTLGATLGAYPFLHKAERLVPPLTKLEIGQQTIGRVQLSRALSRTALVLAGCEIGDYSVENDRTRVFAGIEGSPSGADWVYLRYSAYFQDFDSTSRDYFAPLNEFNQKLQSTFRKSTGPNFFSAGLTLGHSHSSNFGDIFSAAIAGSASRTIAQRWKLFVEGFKSYDDNKYSVGWIRLGLELIL